MAKAAESTGGQRGTPWRAIGWSIPALLLLLPYVTKAPWSGADYIFAAVLFGSVGLVFEFIVRASGSISRRLGTALAILSALLIVTATGAVGMIGDEGAPYDLLFFGVIALALGGALAVRFRSHGMAYAMAAAFIAQAGLGIGGMAVDPRGGLLSALMGGTWLLSAALFWRDARKQSRPAV